MRCGLGLGCVAILLGWCAMPALGQVESIEPATSLPASVVTFDANVNPPSATNPFGTTYSRDAQNILRAHAVARQQVQAAIAFLVSHRRNILAGNDLFYNTIFGDFYNPNSQFAGQYSRTVQVARQGAIVRNPLTGLPMIDPLTGLPQRLPVLDRFGNTVTDTQVNTAHFDRILNTFRQIAAALDSPTQYNFGGHFEPTPVTGQTSFDRFRTAAPLIGDPLFGDAASGTDQQLLDPFDRGFRAWGNSNSYSPDHLFQLANNPNSPLRWDADNNQKFVIDPRTGQALIDPVTGLAVVIESQSRAFFKEKLDIYGGALPATDPLTGAFLATIQQFVGGAFLTEQNRAGSLTNGQAQTQFTSTELRQYQMIVMSFAQLFGAEPGLKELFGRTPFFLEALDSKSFGQFINLLISVQAGGLGNGRDLPPLGKNGAFNGNFLPVIPSS